MNHRNSDAGCDRRLTSGPKGPVRDGFAASRITKKQIEYEDRIYIEIDNPCGGSVYGDGGSLSGIVRPSEGGPSRMRKGGEAPLRL